MTTNHYLSCFPENFIANEIPSFVRFFDTANGWEQTLYSSFKWAESMEKIPDTFNALSSNLMALYKPFTDHQPGKRKINIRVFFKSKNSWKAVCYYKQIDQDEVNTNLSFGSSREHVAFLIKDLLLSNKAGWYYTNFFEGNLFYSFISKDGGCVVLVNKSNDYLFYDQFYVNQYHSLKTSNKDAIGAIPFGYTKNTARVLKHCYDNTYPVLNDSFAVEIPNLSRVLVPKADSQSKSAALYNLGSNITDYFYGFKHGTRNQLFAVGIKENGVVVKELCNGRVTQVGRGLSSREEGWARAIIGLKGLFKPAKFLPETIRQKLNEFKQHQEKETIKLSKMVRHAAKYDLKALTRFKELTAENFVAEGFTYQVSGSSMLLSYEVHNHWYNGNIFVSYKKPVKITFTINNFRTKSAFIASGLGLSSRLYSIHSTSSRFCTGVNPVLADMTKAFKLQDAKLFKSYIPILLTDMNRQSPYDSDSTNNIRLLSSNIDLLAVRAADDNTPVTIPLSSIDHQKYYYFWGRYHHHCGTDHLGWTNGHISPEQFVKEVCYTESEIYQLYFPPEVPLAPEEIVQQ